MKFLKYYFENKKKLFIVLTSIILAIVCIYSFSAIVWNGIIRTSEKSTLDCFEKFSLVGTKNGYFFSEEQVEKLNSYDEIRNSEKYNVVVVQDYVNCLTGQTICYFMYSDNNSIKSIMNNCGYAISTGRMPEDDKFEVVLSEPFLKNKNLKIGDKYTPGDISSDIDSENGLYTIVGSINTEYFVGFGTKCDYVEKLENAGVDLSDKIISYVVFPQDNQFEQLNEKLDNLESDEFVVSNYNYFKKIYDESIGNTKVLLTGLFFIVALAISFALASTFNSIYSSRMEEFAILNAIGYKKSKIIKKILLELLIISVLGLIIALVLSVGILEILNLCIFAKLGLALSLFTGYGIAYSLACILIIFVATGWPTARKLSKCDLISIIERR